MGGPGPTSVKRHRARNVVPAEHAQRPLRARLLDLAILVLAAGVPFAVAVKADNWVVALLSSLTSLLAGMRHVFDLQGDWISFAQANLQIETEVVRSKQALDEYSDEVAAPGILAVRVENIVAVETGTWAQRLPRSYAPSTSSGSSSG